MRHVVGCRAALTDKHAASTSELGCRETEILSIGSNLKKLRMSGPNQSGPDLFSPPFSARAANGIPLRIKEFRRTVTNIG